MYNILSSKTSIKRRRFFKVSALGTGYVMLGSVVGFGTRNVYSNAFSGIKIGICADVHLDTVYDGKQRLKVFIDAMNVEKPDFIVQLGDFCSPFDHNESLLNIWKQFKGPKYHVIGNHDQDDIEGNRIVEYYHFPIQKVVDFWDMSANYYSFDKKGVHFIILDANENEQNPNWKPGTYSSYIGEEQLKWLKNDLDKTKLPVIVFVHQGITYGGGGVENASEVRNILEQSNMESDYEKVQVVFTGHHHLDYHNVIHGIHYIQINSMSYHWIGRGYDHIPYSEELNNEYPYTGLTVPYKDPLWAVVEISSPGLLKLKGKISEFVGKSPTELGVPPRRSRIVPYISDRKLQLI